MGEVQPTQLPLQRIERPEQPFAMLLSERSVEIRSVGQELQNQVATLWRARGPDPRKFVPEQPAFRGMSYNASADELIAMLNIGSISVKTE